MDRNEQAAFEQSLEVGKLALELLRETRIDKRWWRWALIISVFTNAGILMMFLCHLD